MKMARKGFLGMMFLLLVAISVACSSGGGISGDGGGGSDANGTRSNGQGASAGGGATTLKLFNYKVEIAEQLAKLVEIYEQEFGVEIQLETVGGGAGYGDALRAKFAQGDYPDIFNNGGYTDLELYLEHLEDLTDEPWAENVPPFAREPMTHEGRLYGMPVGLEGYGYIYNKDIFAAAGIEKLPKTLTELREAAEMLKAQGITPFSNGYAEWWVLGNHLVNIPFALQDDPDAFIQAAREGNVDFASNEIFQQWVDLLDLTLEFGNPNPLTADYNTSVTLFASGETAMIQQGNWTQVQISSINPDINIGFLPMAINDDADAMDRLPVGVPSNWVIYKHSPVKDQAKHFLNWLVTSETGQHYLTEEFKFIPGVDNIDVEADVLGDLANDIMAYSQEGRTISWVFLKFPGATGTSRELAAAMQSYIAGEMDREQMLNEFGRIMAEAE